MADMKLEGKTAKELLQEGARAFAIGNYTASVTLLSRSSELTAAEHGDKHDSLGEIYLIYGQALLGLSREDGDPLGEAVPKDVAFEADDEDLEDEENGELEEGDVADIGDTEQNEPEKAKSGEKETIEASSTGIEFNGGIEEFETEGDGSKQNPNNEQNTDAGTSGENVEVEEEATDLQLAWEVLELAKLIFQERGDGGKGKLAETLIVLGEVSLENENFENAISDIKQGLEIQKALYDNSNRKVAESYYKLGIALSTNNQMEEAVENFKMSINHLNNRIKKLEDSERGCDKDEVLEIKQLILEIEEKIADMKVYQEEAEKTASCTLKSPEYQGSPEKKAADISHLVKRKRSDNGEGSSSVTKK